MQIQLLMARGALGHMELDMDRHAALSCWLGAWRQRLAHAIGQK